MTSWRYATRSQEEQCASAVPATAAQEPKTRTGGAWKNLHETALAKLSRLETRSTGEGQGQRTSRDGAGKTVLAGDKKKTRS